jgi:hypothetical protein
MEKKIHLIANAIEFSQLDFNFLEVFPESLYWPQWVIVGFAGFKLMQVLLLFHGCVHLLTFRSFHVLCWMWGIFCHCLGVH